MPKQNLSISDLGKKWYQQYQTEVGTELPIMLGQWMCQKEGCGVVNLTCRRGGGKVACNVEHVVGTWSLKCNQLLKEKEGNPSPWKHVWGVVPMVVLQRQKALRAGWGNPMPLATHP